MACGQDAAYLPALGHQLTPVADDWSPRGSPPPAGGRARRLGAGRPAQTGQSDYAVILATMRTYPVPLRLKVPEANPLVSMRVNAVNRLLRGEQGAVRVRIDPSCHESIADLEQVLRDGQKIKKTGRRSDPYFWRTHMSDALSYLLAFDAPTSGTAGPHRPRITSVPLPGYSMTLPSTRARGTP
jgi:hypothetical protein